MKKARPSFFVSLWFTVCLAFVGCQSVNNEQQHKVAAFTAPVRQELKLCFFAVGQGDCNLVEFPDGKRMLVDCGSSSTNGEYPGDDQVRAWLLAALPNHHLDLVVITHPDADHFNHLVGVLGKQIQVDAVMYVGDTSEYILKQDQTTKTWLESFPSNRRFAVTDDRYNTYPAKTLPSLEAETALVLAANVQDGTDTNSRSIVIQVREGQFKALFTGDATKATDKAILERFQGHLGELDVDLWKAAHHGAWATCTQPSKKTGKSVWLDTIKPELVIYPAPRVSTYGHPDIRLAETVAPYTSPAKPHPLHFYEGKGVDTVTPARTAAIEAEAQYQTGTNGSIFVTVHDGKPELTFSKN